MPLQSAAKHAGATEDCTESKGKGSAKVSSAIEELQFLMDFNASITQALFPDSVIKRAEEIAHFESKGQSSLCGKGRYHPYEST